MYVVIGKFLRTPGAHKSTTFVFMRNWVENNHTGNGSECKSHSARLPLSRDAYELFGPVHDGLYHRRVVLFLRSLNRRSWLNSFQPDLTPVGIHTFGAMHSAEAIARLAHNGVQNDARCLHLLHFACALMNDFCDALQNAVSATAVRDEFGIPAHPAIHVRCRDCS